MNDQPVHNETPRTLRTLIQAQAGAPLSTDDVLVLVVPLFEQVASLHAQGRVAVLDVDSVLVNEDGALILRRPEGQAPVMDIGAVHRVQPQPASGLNIIGALQRSHTEDGRHEVTDEALQLDGAAPIERPVYLPGPRSWELLIGHHDEISDTFLLGMTLASLACGIDFADEDDLRRFLIHRRNLFLLHERLHPIVASVIVEMTEVNRHDRATDVSALATRLRTWREQPLSVDVERALAGASGAATRRTAVLTHLRDRLFDLSRRNRLLYFRPGAASVNLTVASVPLMLQIQSIRSEHICTWGGSFAADLAAGRAVPLQRWLRFDDQPYLPAALDRLIAETRRERAEFGFSNLRLVVAFLRWHNLKEAPDERITTPLLWLPVELVKRKGVRDQYVIQCTSGDAEFNPVLRHHLGQLYGIRLDETVDLGKTSLADIHADLLAQIHRSEPSVELRLIDKASVRLVRQKALQRMQQFRRRKPGAAVRTRSGSLPPYSYAHDDYRPLGRALFEHWVRPSDLPQRFEAGAAPRAGLRQPNMSDSAVAEDDRQGFVLEEVEGHRYAWDIDLTQVTLANFNYRKMSLVRDYAQLIDEPGVNPAFDRVFSIEPREVETDAPAPLAPVDQWNVVASDATQNAAVGLARNQRSFIIQGPPGTGKSQTITNLIADYAARGKRVLFVCEKRAALDVVFHRLKQSGLEPLCCLIHDSQADKKSFIADLRTCYEQWISRPHDSDALGARRTQITGNLAEQQRRIEHFESATAEVPAALGVSVRALLRRVADLGAAPETGLAIRERLPTLAVWDTHRELTQRVHRATKERFGLNSLAAHPFARISAQLLNNEHAFGRVEQLCNDVEALFDSLDPVFEDAASLIDQDITLERARSLAADSQWLIDRGLVAHLDLLDVNSAAQGELSRVRAALEERAQALNAALTATANWRDKLSADDTGSALAMTRRLEHSAARWLQPAWWRLRGQLKRRYDFGKHAVHPGCSKVLEALAAEHVASAAMNEVDGECRRRYGVSDMSAFLNALGELKVRLESDNGLRVLVAHLRDAVDPVATALAETRSREVLDKLAARVGDGLTLTTEARLADIAEYSRDLREALDDLPDLLPLLRAVHAADPAYAVALQTIDQPPAQLEALVVDEALRRLERGNPVLAGFNGAALAQTARALADNQRELLALNSHVLQATQHQQFTEHVRQSSLSVTQLDADGKAFKKRYSTGRRELEHEFSKSMRHRSIRELSDAETGAVINDLKPIWLMSPLSVSDTLPLSPDLFDVVIFDEASQIPTEEAVPAMSRANQVIVVGDEMQLPPTSFFSSGGSEGDDEIVVEEEGERIAINLDADSLLNQAARNLPATLLAWHYRSRHESLISFSNAAFYGGRLVTIPDRLLEAGDDEAALWRSDQDDAGIVGADALLARPVSFHQLSDGIYLDRRNEPEARYIAHTVRELLRRETGLSIGIVAFSEAQQSSIESALEALAGEDSDFAARLEREYVREDDDQFNGLFVKNLENVQGDERDVIILSICYGPGPDGRMLMNFGPINQRGGEKRLNVIFSRARHRMAVVSTIQADAITNVHNDGAAALRTFLRFAQASARGQFERAQTVLGALNPGARDAFTRQAASDTIRDALAEALKARGHHVQVNVGRSQFRCDLAIADASMQGYALAILLDAPGEAVVDTVERYVFRPSILRSFGWRVLDIPGKDWLTDSEGVLARIEAMLTDGEDRALSAEVELLAAQQTTPSALSPAPNSADICATEAPQVVQATQTEVVRTLRFEQGGSSKFWRARLRGTELSVSYGRIGSNGQTNLKEFDTPERARREMDKLVAEKLRKGYVEE
ncbi:MULTISPECIES: AAA domain-containing protein [Paraburkholderia]|uniref:AAA domain-containing protein n=1 Tax=Paraburkholderia TaxID=1822464 RepID=UPI002250D3D3|nr:MULTISPECIES: AAA domain-containing protein [Paraburkholderia]MCX4164348.1 AAA domain-containing protein [Paraburkholderia megapolitana]MDN7159841.1 WGR domain-containing protein [Paraburkholderia sp. CHISQ3]MDQ6496888.1 WGR domain-containing protein [Paraburkholderia megapolitana]